MKKTYESPMMIAQAYTAAQNVAGNCKPGVKEYEVSEMDITCSSGSSLWTVILAFFGLAHDHGAGLTDDSNNCIASKSTTIFTADCTNKVSDGNLRTYNGNSYIAYSWESNSSRGNHTALIKNGNASQPTYFTS